MFAYLNIAHLNVRSLLAHFSEFKDMLQAASYDVLGVTETWLTDQINTDVIQIPGYNFIRIDRITTTRGGGVGMYIRTDLHFDVLPIDPNNQILEQLWINLKLNKTNLVLGVMYRRQEFAGAEFFEAFEDSLSIAITYGSRILYMGDLNIDLLKVDHALSIQMMSLLHTFGHKQIIDVPTRIGKTCSTLIDYMVTSDDIDVLESGATCMDGISDHHLVYCKFPTICLNSYSPTYYTYRDFRRFDIAAFESDLMSHDWHQMFALTNIDEKVNFLNLRILATFDKHASRKTVKITRPPAPWLTDNIKFMISLRNKALTRFRQTKKPSHWDYYKQLRNYVTHAVRSEKKAYILYACHNGGITSSTTWRKLRQMGVVASRNKCEIPTALCDVDKLNQAFTTLSGVRGVCDTELLNFYNANRVNTFKQPFLFQIATTSDVVSAFNAIKSNSTGSDNISLHMWKLCLPRLLPYILHIINSCLLDGSFPLPWKVANVIPLPKVKVPNGYGDLRPISILPCISKVLEKIMSAQIRSYIEKEGILPEMQSGFRSGYSCNTALLHVTDSIMSAIDRNHLAVLILLDYSKAFDRLNHDLLIAVLRYIGFDAMSTRMVENYIRHRTQRVIFKDNVSKPLSLINGVPQGSILGPLLYVIYTSQITKSLSNCAYHLYADDTQLVYTFGGYDINQANRIINVDLDRLIKTSERHGLLINMSKCYVMLFGRVKTRSDTIDSIKIKIKDKVLPVVDDVKNLGVTFDYQLRFKKHISELLRRAYCNLKLIYSNRQYLNRNIRAILCEALVLSHFNHCDTVYGPCLDVSDMKRIQRMQNSCLRLIFGVRKHDHISNKLVEVKWLNMANRRLLHAATLYHRIITTKVPPYLYSRIAFSGDAHNVNIRSKNVLRPPRYYTTIFQRSFTYNVFKLYNSLAYELKNCTVKQFNNRFKKILYLSQL
uniref:Reverse transcriptase domain-containing protein n=1 Tax=Photinus pyralis TaxID=7054 RepID=A0A1Y1M3U5_PHOPY